MLEAPEGSIYIWVNQHLTRPRDVAEACGRTDLHIVSPAWLDLQNIMGCEFKGVVLDHALPMSDLSDAQFHALQVAYTRVRVLP